MLRWSLELFEFDIQYEGRKTLKAQALAYFVVEMTAFEVPSNALHKWKIFVDRASSSTGSGEGILLENEEGVVVEHSLVLSFPTSNKQAEYEALLAGLCLVKDLDALEVYIFTDSQPIASQVWGEYQAKNDILVKYLAIVKKNMDVFKHAEINHIPRE